MISNSQSLEIVIGLPGSGKTTYLKKLVADGQVDVMYDDYQNGAPEDDRSNPRKSPNFGDLRRNVRKGCRVAISEIRYCDTTELTMLLDMIKEEFPGIKPQLVYFANDPEACKHNVRLRRREGYIDKEPRYVYELRFIDEHSPQYNPPQNQTIPVIMG